MRPAADRWREQLQAWAIPAGILAAAPESPYGFPTELFRHRAELAAARADTLTTLRALTALPEGGTVLDVGCGGGATSLPLARRAAAIVGVDGQPELLEIFEAAAMRAGVEARGVLGLWPDVALQVPMANVVVCGHVAYNVADLAPFARALDSRASRRVVVELTDRHPLAWMNDLWELFHGVRRPEGPAADDALAVLHQEGIDGSCEQRTAGDEAAGGGFKRREDAVALVRRRLCLPPERDDEVAKALGQRLRRRGELWSAGPPEQTIVTLWWDPRA